MELRKETSMRCLRWHTYWSICLNTTKIQIHIFFPQSALKLHNTTCWQPQKTAKGTFFIIFQCPHNVNKLQSSVFEDLYLELCTQPQHLLPLSNKCQLFKACNKCLVRFIFFCILLGAVAFSIFSIYLDSLCSNSSNLSSFRVCFIQAKLFISDALHISLNLKKCVETSFDSPN